MTARRKTGHDEAVTRRPPAKTPVDRENQLIALATDVAEQQMRAGTASAQVISYYLKLGSSRERLEQERLRHENELMQAKRELMAAGALNESLAAEAIKAMRSYTGMATEGAPE